MTSKALAAACGMLLLASRPALAQASPAPTGHNIFVGVNYAWMAQTIEDTSNFSFPLYGETGTVAVTRRVGPSGFPNFTAGVMLSPRFGLAFDFSDRSAKADGQVDAVLPDPGVFGHFNSVTSTVSDLKHHEQWYGAFIVYPLASMRGIQIVLLGGPSVTRVQRDVVTSVSVPSVGAAPQVGTENLSRTLFSGQVGVDVRHPVSAHVDVGGFVRYVVAKGNLGPTVKVDLSGVHAGGGVRLHF